jgi:hypothetical protein
VTKSLVGLLSLSECSPRAGSLAPQALCKRPAEQVAYDDAASR